MNLSEIDTGKLLEAGIHFGHRKHMWDPRMKKYLFGVKQDTHIIDLTQTVILLKRAMNFITDIAADGGRILFVGTKRQAEERIAETAQRSAQYYINKRWFGGTLTNWQTISISIKRLKELERNVEAGYSGLTKKENLDLKREMQRLQKALGGVKDMGGIPDAVFVIDTNREKNAIAEARKLNIPVIAIIDSNSNPEGIDFPIPGNDDSRKAIELYCELAAEAVLEGINRAKVKKFENEPQNKKEDKNEDKKEAKKLSSEQPKIIDTQQKQEITQKTEKAEKTQKTENIEQDHNKKSTS